MSRQTTLRTGLSPIKLQIQYVLHIFCVILRFRCSKKSLRTRSRVRSLRPKKVILSVYSSNSIHSDGKTVPLSNRSPSLPKGKSPRDTSAALEGPSGIINCSFHWSERSVRPNVITWAQRHRQKIKVMPMVHSRILRTDCHCLGHR
jgi:hypothetical protein